MEQIINKLKKLKKDYRDQKKTWDVAAMDDHGVITHIMKCSMLYSETDRRAMLPERIRIQ